MQPVNEPPCNSPPPNEEREIPGDHNIPEGGSDAEAFLPLDNKNEPSESENPTLDDKMKESELLTTTHLHFKDEEPMMPSAQPLEEDNKNKHDYDLNN